MGNRVKDYLGNTYRIFEDNSILPYMRYAPTEEAINNTKKFFKDYAAKNGKQLTDFQAETMVNTVIKSAQKQKGPPGLPFKYIDDTAADEGPELDKFFKNILTDQIKPTRILAETRGKDKATIQALFGKIEDPRFSIYNSMTKLSSIARKNELFERLAKQEEAVQKAVTKNTPAGARGFFFDDPLKASAALPNQDIVELDKYLLPFFKDEFTVNPLAGKFTSKAIAEGLGDSSKALQFLFEPRAGATGVEKGLTWGYRNLILFPKALSQVAKTILAPVTHFRNIFSATGFSAANGIFFENPAVVGRAFADAFGPLQTGAPIKRTIGKLTGTTFDEAAANKRYRKLLDLGVVNSQVQLGDVKNLLRDVRFGENLNLEKPLESIMKKLTAGTGRKVKGFFKGAEDLYTAEDDVFRVYNFLAEAHKLDNAFEIAIKKGLKDASGKVVTRANKPSDLAIMKEAAQIVRETVPNYAYVSDFVKSVRRSPFGSFAAFPAEIYRTGTNTLMRGLKEVKDPIRKQIGYNSLVGQGFTYTFLPVAAVELFRGMYGITREQLSAIREVLPTWSEDNTILPIYEDGKYKYIDFSHGCFYDTMIQPVQTTLSTVQKGGDDKPLVPMILDAMVKAGGKVLEPFIQEAIWTSTVLDLFVRGGVTKDGRRVFNERDELGDKISKSFQHAAYELSPFSYAQILRLSKALTGDTLKGEKYQIPDELLGFTGFRKVPINLEKNLNFKIAEFKRNTFEERKLIYQGTRTGDPVKDENRIIRQYIKANKQHLESYSKLRRIYDAVKVLGMRDSKISEEFADQKSIPVYGFIEDNAFKPFSISKDVIAGFDKLFEEKGIPNPLNDRVLDKLDEIADVLYEKQKLNEPFVINEKDYLLPETNTSMVPPLPEQPMPNAAVVQTPAPVTETGLTMVEKALLSDEEKMMTLKNRGLA